MKPNRHILLSGMAAAAVMAITPLAPAQEVTGTLGSPDATTTLSGKQLPPPDPKFGGVDQGQGLRVNAVVAAARRAAEEGAQRATDYDRRLRVWVTRHLRRGDPDTGPGPHREERSALHEFPLDLALLADPRGPHHRTQPSFGGLRRGGRNRDRVSRLRLDHSGEKGTIGTILKDNGYSTSWFGKDHNTPFFANSQAGPFEQWPIGMGFEYFYGFVGGDASQWEPNLFRNTTPIYPFEGKPGWNLTTAMADEAIQHMKQLKELAPDKPFFVYYVPGGVHAPHHPTKEWIDKISAMHLFDDGWEKLRDTIFANQKKLGILPKNAELTPWPDGQDIYGGAKLPRWDSLDLEQKKLFIKQADVYAAYQAYTDYEVGRVVQAVEDLGELDNTLIIYISGDNGASAEGMVNGTPNEFTTFNGVEVPVKDQFLWYPFWGSARTYPHFSAAWAWAFDTPFKWMKQVPSHFGGTAQGVAMSWPGHIKDVGGIRRQFAHIIDIVPTILEATGIPAPETINGIPQKPVEGTSMVYTWDKANADAPTKHTTQYFEMLGNRAIYHDGWVACTTPATIPWELTTKPAPDVITGYKWELYNVAEDPTQNNDLAAKMPDKLTQLQNLFYLEAAKYDVLPLDNSSLTRWNTPRPSLTAGRTTFTYSGSLASVPGSTAPDILNKPYSITAEVTIPGWRRRGHDRHRGRAFRRLRPFPEQGRVWFRSGQSDLSLQPARSQTHGLGRAGAEARKAHHRLRLQSGGAGTRQGRHRCAHRGWQGSGQKIHGTLDTDHVPRRRDLRRRPGHAHRGRGAGISLRKPVSVHRNDRQADLQPQTIAHAGREDGRDAKSAGVRCRCRGGDRTGLTGGSFACRAIAAW